MNLVSHNVGVRSKCARKEISKLKVSLIGKNMTLQIIEKHIRLYLRAYLVISLMLSLVVFVRLAFALNTEFLNIVLYDVYYYVMPSIAIFILLVLLEKRKSEKRPERQKFPFAITWIVFIIVFLALFFIDISFNTPLSYVIFPLIPVPITYLYFNSKKSEYKLLSRKMTAFTLTIIILMPYIATFSGFNLALSVARSAQNDTDRVEFVSDYVRVITTSSWGLRGIEGMYVGFHRASSDFLKFLLVGAGSCSEMAHATKAIFDNLDLESRIVSLPGEDHMFVEVKLNGTWLVVDPGYRLNLVTREERGSRRLEELGGLSYVVAYTGQGLVELTHYYVTTDRIVIRVTENGEPIANANIVLKHTFMGNKMRLPEFHSDVNGTIELNLGPLTYNNSKIEPAEPYYWIYVNDQNTRFKVDSMGSGRFVYIEVDLTDVSRGK